MCHISHAMRVQVWNYWIGLEIGKTFCLLCQRNIITQLEFICGHVLAKSRGGEISIENLRPICFWCNCSMGTHHMYNFAKANYPQPQPQPPISTPIAVSTRVADTNHIVDFESETEWVCSTCAQSFTLKGSLTRHQKRNICTKPKLSKRELSDRYSDLVENQKSIDERLRKIELNLK